MSMSDKSRRTAPVWGLVGLFLGSSVLGSPAVYAQTPETQATTDTDEDQAKGKHDGLLLDIKDYYTAPLHWDLRDWAYFGGAAAAVAGAHHYDTQVRTHFIKRGAR